MVRNGTQRNQKKICQLKRTDLNQNQEKNIIEALNYHKQNKIKATQTKVSRNEKILGDFFCVFSVITIFRLQVLNVSDVK